MSDREEQDQKGFKVTDRRSFTSAGERRTDVNVDAESDDAAETETENVTYGGREAERASVGGATRVGRAGEAPGERTDAVFASEPGLEVAFLDLLAWLATQASLALGEPHPVTGESHEDLQGARAMISMIEVLDAKTKGNLSREEREALESVLYQLRMQFLAKAEAGKG